MLSSVEGETESRNPSREVGNIPQIFLKCCVGEIGETSSKVLPESSLVSVRARYRPSERAVEISPTAFRAASGVTASLIFKERVAESAVNSGRRVSYSTSSRKKLKVSFHVSW